LKESNQKVLDPSHPGHDEMRDKFSRNERESEKRDDCNDKNLLHRLMEFFFESNDKFVMRTLLSNLVREKDIILCSCLPQT
jgi:hypothetical protein